MSKELFSQVSRYAGNVKLKVKYNDYWLSGKTI